jgi:hypothetical protein
LVNIVGIERLPEICPVIFTLPMVLAATALDAKRASDPTTAAPTSVGLRRCF